MKKEDFKEENVNVTFSDGKEDFKELVEMATGFNWISSRQEIHINGPCS